MGLEGSASQSQIYFSLGYEGNLHLVCTNGSTQHLRESQNAFHLPIVVKA